MQTISMKFEGRPSLLMNQLAKAGHRINYLKDSFAIDVVEKDSMYEVPSVVQNLKIARSATLVYEEKKLANGDAIIVADAYGKPLIPGIIPKRSKEMQARFFPRHTCLLIYGKATGAVTVCRVKLDDRGKILKIFRQWTKHSNVNKLLPMLHPYRKAIEAAVEKAKCPNCRHVHWGRDKNY